MEARNDSIEHVDQFDFWVGPTQLNAQILLPREPKAVVTVAYSGELLGTESYVYGLARRFRVAGLGTVLVDCMPDTYRGDDYRSPLRQYLPGVLCSRMTGALARISSHEALDAYPLGSLGLGACAGAAIGAAGRYDLADAVVSVGGRPEDALELADQVSAPTLVLRDCAKLLEDLPREKPLNAMFTGNHESIQYESAEPPFIDAQPFSQVTSLAKNWFIDELAPSPPPTPNLTSTYETQKYGLPPTASLLPEWHPRRAAR